MTPQPEGYQNILKLSCRPFVFTLSKAKTKNRSKTSIPASFFGMTFEEKFLESDSPTSKHVLIVQQV